MTEDWFNRFIEMVEADGRGMINIALTAGLGRNYVQQIIKNGKKPTIERLMAILQVLGESPTIYVLTGVKTTPEDKSISSLLNSLTEEEKKAFLVLLQSKLPPTR